MPISGLPQDMKIAAKHIMVFFDDQQQDNTIKRLTIILDTKNKGLVIDSMDMIGVIDVIVNDNMLGSSWAPRERGIGLLRKIGSDKFSEKIVDPNVRHIFNLLANANEHDTIPLSGALIMAKAYIDAYPLESGLERGA